RLVGASFTGQEAIDAILVLVDDSSKTVEVAVENTYEITVTPGTEESGGGGGQVGLSPESFKFQNVTSNWQAAGVTGLSLSVTNRQGKTREVKFEIEVGLPIKLKNKVMISTTIAKIASAKAANQAAIDIGSMAQVTNGKFYLAPSLVQKTFATSMQVHLNSSIKELLDLPANTTIGSRVNSPIQSDIVTKPAVWNQITIIDQLKLIIDRFF